MKVYVINKRVADFVPYQELSDKEFIAMAEYDGMIYELNEWETRMNKHGFDPAWAVMRFI